MLQACQAPAPTRFVNLERKLAAAARLPGGVGVSFDAVPLADRGVDPAMEPTICLGVEGVGGEPIGWVPGAGACPGGALDSSQALVSSPAPQHAAGGQHAPDTTAPLTSWPMSWK